MGLSIYLEIVYHGRQEISPIRIQEKEEYMDITLAVVNANVITMNDHQQAEAFAVCNDRIARVGTTEEILALANPMTKIMD